MNFPHQLRFTPMTLDDLAIVSDLEQQCFTSPWSVESYRRELETNRFCAYWVARLGKVQSGEVQSGEVRSDGLSILAYGGYWLMGEETHIVTIATHPTQQGQGIGTWFLEKMLIAAQRAGASEATLEVRVSNRAAIALYTKAGFVEAGRRIRYYRDNGEDALILTLYDLSSIGQAR